jgi:[acyl-carrier-protein] S-malonyltransferase
MSKYIITFPGQGSQSIGMMNGLSHIPIIKKTFTEASEILNKDFWTMTSSENLEINQTVNTQPLMLTAGVATWRYLQENNLDSPSFVAGHSLGEFTALVASNSVTFNDALKMVTKRAELMQNAVPEGEGAMAAIIGLDDQKVIEVCNEEQGNKILEAVNFNSPGQVVIAGTKSTLEKSLQSFKDAGAKRARMLPVSVPSHCKLMQPASILFDDYLKSIVFNMPKFPIVQNYEAMHYNEIEKIKSALVRQIFNPVRWTETIKLLSAEGINLFIEAGPGKVLTGLNRRINIEASHVSVTNEEVIGEIFLKIKELKQ